MGAYSTLEEHLNSRLIIIIIIVNYPNNMNMTMFAISSCSKVFSKQTLYLSMGANMEFTLVKHNAHNIILTTPTTCSLLYPEILATAKCFRDKHSSLAWEHAVTPLS